MAWADSLKGSLTHGAKPGADALGGYSDGLKGSLALLVSLSADANAAYTDILAAVAAGTGILAFNFTDGNVAYVDSVDGFLTLSADLPADANVAYLDGFVYSTGVKTAKRLLLLFIGH